MRRIDKKLFDNKKDDVIAALMDELDSSEFHSASAMWTTLKSSSQSRFNGKQKIMAISYSRYESSSGMIRRLYEENLDNPHAYVMRYPSWEFNPRPEYTRASLDAEFKANQDEAQTIYGSNPPSGFLDSWIKDSGRVHAAMGQRSWIFDFPPPSDNYRKNAHTEFMRPDPEKPHTEAGETNWIPLDPFNLPVKFRGIPRVKYVFCGDPALGKKETGGDGYGVCLAHREKITRENGETYVRPVIDLAFRFTGQMFKNGEVQMAAIEKLIKDLREEHGYDISVFSFDSWNSASTLQNLARDYPGVVIYKHTVGAEDYSALKDAIFGEAPPTEGGPRELNGGIEMPRHPILYTELKELRIDKQRKAGPDHPADGSKDIADTVARAVNLMVNAWPVLDILVSGDVRQEKATIVQKNILGNSFFRGKKEKKDEVAEEGLRSLLFGAGKFKSP